MTVAVIKFFQYNSRQQARKKKSDIFSYMSSSRYAHDMRFCINIICVDLKQRFVFKSLEMKSTLVSVVDLFNFERSFFW